MYVNGNPPNFVDPSGMIYEVWNSCAGTYQQSCTKEDFPYGSAERQAVAKYASDSSRSNFAKYKQLRAVGTGGFDPRKGTLSGGKYPITGEEGVSTYSAAFISDSLFFGTNFPMTGDWNVQPSQTSPGFSNPSAAWGNHPQLRDFLTGHGARDVFNFSINPSKDTFAINNGGTVNTADSQPLIDFIQSIQTVRRGDYFLTGEPPTHGAIVAGWGPLKDCGAVTGLEDAGTPDTLVEGSNFASYGGNFSDLLVPYVTDSNYAVEQKLYRHTQDPRPRPIYCLKATTKDTLTYNGTSYGKIFLNPSYFSATPWHFVVMPDTFHVPCSEQISSTLQRQAISPKATP